MQLVALEQAFDETQLSNVVNNMEIDAASLGFAVGQSDNPVSTAIDLAVMASAAAASNIINEYAYL